jgi:ribosomal protein S21
MSKQSKHFKSIIPGSGVAVKVLPTKQYPKGDINSALKSFKRELKESGKIQELKDRKEFKSKSQKRKEVVDRAKYYQWLDDQNQ